MLKAVDGFRQKASHVQDECSMLLQQRISICQREHLVTPGGKALPLACRKYSALTFQHSQAVSCPPSHRSVSISIDRLCFWQGRIGQGQMSFQDQTDFYGIN